MTAVTSADTAAGCAAPDQAAPIPASVDLEKETVITGTVVADSGEVVAGAYVRLLDSTGEFTAEVVTSPEGLFRFFAAPGTWTLRALSRHGNGDATVTAGRGINQVGVTVA
jgi:DNA/RNA endonuclease YhcR with UshA esterase domain